MNVRQLIQKLRESPDHKILLERPQQLMNYAKKYFPEINQETLTRYARKYKNTLMEEEHKWNNKIVEFEQEQLTIL